MAFNYSGDPSASDLDQVRFLIQDTDSGLPLLQDEEIDWLIAQWMPRYDSLLYVAAVCAAQISKKFTGIVNVTADGVSVNTADLAQRYRDMAAELRDEYKDAQTAGAEINIDNVLIGTDIDYSIRPLRFGVGLMDNPMAGNQDYGGWTFDPFADAAATSWP